MTRHVIDGPAAWVPARVCWLLGRHIDLARLRVAARGRDPELAAVLMDLHMLGLAWAEQARSATRPAQLGTSFDNTPEPGAACREMTATQAADRTGVTSRAVRKAAQQGRLHGRLHGGCWLFDPADVANWRTTRHGA